MNSLRYGMALVFAGAFAGCGLGDAGAPADGKPAITGRLASLIK